MTATTTIEPGLFARVGKRTTSYSTRLAGEYVALGNDLDAARRKLAALLELPPTGETVETMCKAYLAEQWGLLRARDPVALAEGTLIDYEVCLLKRVLPVFGSMRPQDLEPMHAAQYLDKRRKAGNGPRANREMAALSSAFNYGMRCGSVRANPCRGVRRNKERPRTRRVSVAELNAFLAFAKAKGGSAYLVALIGAATALSGRRRGELLRLPRTAATAEGILVADCKTKAGEAGRHYLVEWSPTLRQVFTESAAIKRRVSSIFLFPTLDGQAYTDSGFKCLWNKLMHAYVPGGTASEDWFRAHDLRALYVSEMLEQERNPNTHKNEQTMRTVYDRRRIIKVTPLA